MIAIKTRSHKSAVAAALAAGFTEDQVAITKLATARYEVVMPARSAPTEKSAPVRAARPVRADRHYNDDDTVTLYLGGRKIFRTDEGEEDAEEWIERYMNRHFAKKNGGWVYGRSTHGHNWHTKKAKAARLAAAAKG